MARRPDVPCARCGHLLWGGTTSLPAGQRMCQPCRRIEPQRAIITTANPRPRASQCRRCDAPVPADRFRYCSRECARKVRNARPASPTSDRGYGTAHQRLRAQLLPLAYGTPCHHCGDVMEEGQELHLDHNEDRTGYRGMAHAKCNLLDGARRGNETRRQRRLAMGSPVRKQTAA